MEEPAPAAFGFTDADAVAQLEQALISRTSTGQATGLLAARFGVTTGEAWSLLREVSNLSNQKLARVAQLIVHVHDGVRLPGSERQLAVSVAGVLDVAVARIRSSATGGDRLLNDA